MFASILGNACVTGNRIKATKPMMLPNGRASALFSHCKIACIAMSSSIVLAIFTESSLAQRISATHSTTMSGIYKASQAVRGEQIYMGLCVSCHPTGSYSGPVFVAVWGERPLSDLFSFIKERMPKENPGSLTSTEAAQITAYILRLNRLPVGIAELPSEAAMLKDIVIELRESHSMKK